MQILVSAECAGGDKRGVESHEERGENHHAANHVEHGAAAEALAVDGQQDKSNREVENGSKHQRALELQERQQQQTTASRTDDGTERIPAIDLADRGFGLECACEDNRNEWERHAGKETRRHHPKEGQHVLEDAPAHVAVIRGIEYLVRLVHHHPERLMEIERTQREERHENLGERKHHQRIFFQQLAADRTADGKAENKGRKHLVEAVARRTHEQAEQTDPDNLVDKGGKAGNGGDPEPGALGRHREFGIDNDFLDLLFAIVVFAHGRGPKADNAKDGR